MGEFIVPGLGLGLSGEGRVVDLEASGFDNTNIGGHPITKLDLDDITDGQLLGFQSQLLSVPDAQGVLGHKVLERFHNLGGLGFL